MRQMNKNYIEIRNSNKCSSLYTKNEVSLCLQIKWLLYVKAKTDILM